jgi:cysteine desulfurase/selenocysteine lyase
MTTPGSTTTAKVRKDRAAGFDVAKARQDFPILREKVQGKPLVYFDNAATSQKPQVVIDTVHEFLATYNSNIHRGVHQLSERGTEAYEQSRKKVQRFINAAESREVIFVRGTTEAINLVAHSYGRQHIRAGDEIVISAMEHHSNIVPWQILCEQTGAVLRVVPISDAGEMLIDEYEKLLTSRTRLVAVVHVSNALGTINPVHEIIRLARRQGVPVLVDGAQAVPHLKVDVHELDCDFYAFSGHKVFGPTGIGVLYGKAELLEAMPPYQGGGDMIKSVSFEKTVYNDLPYKFEAGTPHIAGVIGLGAAIDYVNGVRIIGTAEEKVSLISFVLDGVHAHDVGTILDHDGVAIRAGHHCTMPLMQRFGVPATARASLAFYNTKEEIDVLVRAIHKAIEMFG